MSNTTADARVTTVTAEVRVLMVGSRQVTLSVAKQLDRVDLGEIDPFGRVRLGDGQHLIGRSRKDGALALAQFERHPARVPYIYGDDLGGDSNAVVCDKQTTAFLDDRVFALRFGDREIRLDTGAVTRCGRHPYGITDTGKCETWDPAGNEKQIQAAIDAWDARAALHDQAAALPLIVLAGLR